MVHELGKVPSGVPGRVLETLARIGLDHGVLDVGTLSGSGNSSYLVTYQDDRLVVRFDGQATTGLVDRNHEYRHMRLAAQSGLGPDIVHADLGHGVLVTRFAEGTRFDRLPRPYARGSLGRLARAIARLQACDGFGGLMDPWAKIALYLQDAAVDDPAGTDGFGPAWSKLESLRVTTRIDPDDLVPCHVDPVPENLLDRDDNALLLDWEYAALSHRLWDPAYFASEASLSTREREVLLHALGWDDKHKELQHWIVLAKAVSFAWCLARRARASEDREIWKRILGERGEDLQNALQESGL